MIIINKLSTTITSFNHQSSKMKKHESIFAMAAETAANSPFHMAHGAVLVHSGVVLSTAHNHLGGNRLSPSCPSTHAEIASLARFFGGSVKQCFEKPHQDLLRLDEKRYKSGFDPGREASQRVSGRPRQRQQRVPRLRCLGATTIDPWPETCFKRKGPGGRKQVERVCLRN